jgi:hypothetical protein
MICALSLSKRVLGVLSTSSGHIAAMPVLSWCHANVGIEPRH